MYDELWYWLPGPVWFKTVLCLVVAVGVFFLLMNVVFPWLGPLLPGSEVSVGDAG